MIVPDVGFYQAGTGAALVVGQVVAVVGTSDVTAVVSATGIVATVAPLNIIASTEE